MIIEIIISIKVMWPSLDCDPWICSQRALWSVCLFTVYIYNVHCITDRSDVMWMWACHCVFVEIS